MNLSQELKDPQYMIDLFNKAAEQVIQSPLRNGALTTLPEKGRLVIAGDLHDHQLNLQKALKVAALDESPDHHLIVQELIHGPALMNGMDFSYRMLGIVADLQLRYPGQVHVLLGNHELSQANGDWVMKDGINCVEAFDMGLDFVFSGQADAIHEAMVKYILSMALAVRTESRLLCSHSLPAPSIMDRFDTEILTRPWVPEDVTNIGPVFQLVWGRRFPDFWQEKLSQAWEVDTFVIGHMPTDTGYDCIGESLLVVNSDSDHGVLLKLDLSRKYLRDDLLDQIVYLSGVIL